MVLSLPSRGRGLKWEKLSFGSKDYASLPSRGRGLKYVTISKEVDLSIVAPLAGAWIEISGCRRHSSALPSLPSRGRGLKCGQRKDHACGSESLPSRGRGLK